MTRDDTQPIPLSDPLVGTRLGEYEVLEPIGEGGMGVVYRGVQPVIKKQVAIKVLKPAVGRDATQVRRLIDEAEAVNSVRHRNIIDIFSLGQLPDGRPYIVMEFLEGQPLDSLMAAAGRFPVPEAVALLAAVCSPLGAAHRANVIHRDLKPSNIFVCRGADGERYLKLLDFGLAKKASLGGSTDQTSRFSVAGTPNYMAPEQAQGQQVSARTDLYALGVMAYQMVTGRLPYSGPGPFEVMFMHASAPIPLVRDVLPEVPPALDELIARLMAKAPGNRVQTAEEVRAVLLEVARALGAGPGFEASEPVSREYLAGSLWQGATPQGLPALGAGTADTVISQSSVSLEPRGKRVALAVAGLVALVVVALVALLRPAPGEATSDRLPSVPAQPLPHVVVVEPPAVPVGATPDPPPTEPAEPAPAAPDPAAAAHRSAPPTKRVEPPSAAALRARVARLDAALARSAPAGEEPDPSAAALLRKYKVEATMLDTAQDRAQLSKNLDLFERAFLRR